MAAIIVFTYLTIGAIYAVVTFAFFDVTSGPAASSRSPVELVVMRAARELQMAKAGNRLRWLAGRLLSIPIAIICWPSGVVLVILYRGNSPRETLGNMVLAPSILLATASSLLFAVILLALRLVGQAHWAIDIGAILLTISLLSQFISYVLVGKDLPSLVREGHMPPYIQFLLAAGAAYATLLIGSILLERLRTGGTLSRSAVIQQVKGLNAFSHVADSLRATERTPIALLITTTGIMFFVTFGKLLFQYKRFNRTAEDYAGILNELVYTGDFDQARKLFDSLPADVRNDPKMLLAKIRLLCQVQDFKAAYRATQTLLELNSPLSGIDSDSTEEVLGRLLSLALLTPLPARVRWDLMGYAVQLGAGDAFVCIVTNQLTQSLKFWEWSTNELQRQGITSHKYPITVAFVQWLDATDEEAEVQWEQALEEIDPSKPEDRALRLHLLVFMRLRRSRDEKDLVDEFTRSIRTDGLPLWFRLELRTRIRGMIRRVKSTNQQRALNDAVEEMVRGVSPVLLAEADAISNAEFQSRR
jgi:hypothetical protein